MPLTRNQTSAAAAQSKTGGAEPAETSMTKDNGEQGGTSSESDPPRRDSPDNCSICLGPFINKSFTSSCAHSFCFVCLKQWSKVKAECPLCKQPFTSIFHNIRSNQMYDIYELPRQPPNQMNQYNIYDYVGGGLATFTAPTHHYLSLPQPFDADLTLSNFSRFQFRHRRYDRYLNPLIQGEHPYSFTPAVNPTAHVSAASWPRGPEDFRREVYRHNLGPPVVILGNENSTYRLTPTMVAASSHRLHRIMPWLTRELRVLLRSHQNVRLAISMIQPLLTQVSIDSVYFHERVATLIGRRSRTFIQEFVAFANSALSMQAFDRKAMYRRRDESVAPSSPSSTSSENEVVEITDVSPDPVPTNVVPESQTSSSQPLDLRRSGWDSPTPGPSWSSLGVRDSTVQAVPVDRVSVSSESDDPVYIPNLRDSDSDNSKAGSDIIFVKYDKPWEERSPINLTSESEKETETERVKKKKKSKHKKKRKQSVEKSESSKTDKSHKSSRGKSQGKEKSKSSSKGATGERRVESTHKRHHTLSSPETLKRKKRKKSRDKRDKPSDPNKDRELVDRLFAEAIAQQQRDHTTTVEEKTGDSPRSGKEKDRSSRSSTRDKSKKKKRKNHSRDSHSPSVNHSFKKHHSGHKKSSNAGRSSQTSTSERNHPHHKSSATEADKGPVPTGQASDRNSHDLDRENLNQPHSSTSMPHSVTSGFHQPSYLTLPPDTVQHIPVNLWVSTWPALPVSHTYHPHHPPTPSSNLPGTSSHTVPQNSSSSFPSVVPGPGPSTAALDSHTVSSDSSTEYDSDDAQDRQIPSLKNVDSRTMHWLETHCPDLGRLQPNSSSATEAHNVSMSSATSTSSSSTSSDTAVSNVIRRPQPVEAIAQRVEKENEDSHINVEVVSVGSGEEDVVICSSASNSDSDDVHCLEEQPPPLTSRTFPSCSKETDPVPSTSKFFDGTGGQMSTVPFLPDFNNPLVDTSTENSLFLPSGSKTFQPFKLQRKSALTHQGKDPFFPSMSHSSDEEDENVKKSDTYHPQNSLLKEVENASSQMSGSSTVSRANTISTLDMARDKLNASIARASQGEKNGNLKYSTENNGTTATEGNEHWKSRETNEEPLDGQIYESTSVSHPTSTLSTSGPDMFSALSSMSQPTPPVSSVLPSSLNYLPYSSLPPPPQPASHPSILPQQLPFSIPPPAAQPQQSLSLHFPFPSLTPSMLSQSQRHTLLPPTYPTVSQDSTSSLLASGEQAQQSVSETSDLSTSLTYQPETLLSETCPLKTNERQAATVLDCNFGSENDKGHFSDASVVQGNPLDSHGETNNPNEISNFVHGSENGSCSVDGKEKDLDLFSELDCLSTSHYQPEQLITGAQEKADEGHVNEDANQTGSLNFFDISDGLGGCEPPDFLELEAENSSAVNSTSIPMKTDEQLKQPEIHYDHQEVTNEANTLQSSVDCVIANNSYIDESNLSNVQNSHNSDFDGKTGDNINAQNLFSELNVDSKSGSTLPCKENDYGGTPNVQESQLIGPGVSNVFETSDSERDIEVAI